MRSLVLLVSVLSVSFAGYISPIPTIYSSPYQYVPTIGINGVPVDTLEVQTAKAAHFAAKAEARARNGDYTHGLISPLISTYASPIFSTYATSPVYSTYTNTLLSAANSPIAYSGYRHIPIIGNNGVPLDTPAVQSAKAAHLIAKSQAIARNAASKDEEQSDATNTESIVTSAETTYSTKYTGPQHIPTIGIDGVPVDTPAVQSAKAAHFAAKAVAQARNADAKNIEITIPVATTYTSGAVTPLIKEQITTKYTGPQHIPIIGTDGVPVDTPAVQAAKAAHFAAKAKAEAAASNEDNLEGVVIKGAESAESSDTVSVSTSSEAQDTSSGSQHIPTIGTDGVPVDTPAVQSARAAHFAAKAVAEAKAGSGETDEGTTVTSISAPVVSTYISSPAVSYISKPLISSYLANPLISSYGALYNGYTTYSPVITSKIPVAYPTTIGYPTIVNGVPQETPEVVAAKSNHLAAHVKALIS